VRAGERPSRRFWLARAAGLVAVLAFVAASEGGARRGRSRRPLPARAAALCAIGYAEGGALSRTLGGRATICWALVLSAPVTATVAAVARRPTGLHAGTTAWLGFAYVSVVSMFLGFFAWYAGLARGGVARVGQVQLAQPVLTLVWSALAARRAVGALTSSPRSPCSPAWRRPSARAEP
jgi:drug/metabolite transporter (DMT)-like permease